MIRTLGVKGGVGYAYEFAGPAIEAALDGGADDPLQHGHRGRRPLRLRQSRSSHLRLPQRSPPRPSGEAWDRAVSWWEELGQRMPMPCFDDEVKLRCRHHRPHHHLGDHPRPGALGIDEAVPTLEQTPEEDRPDCRGGLPLHGSAAGPSDCWACLWMCVSSAAAPTAVSAICAPWPPLPLAARWPQASKPLLFPDRSRWRDAEAEGLDAVFRQAGFEWREPGCSMCLAMNPDRLKAAKSAPAPATATSKAARARPVAHTADEPGDGLPRPSPAMSPTFARAPPA